MKALEAALTEIKAFPLFHDLAKDTVAELCKNGQIVSVNHREKIFKSGEPALFFGIVLSGAFKLSKPSPLGEDVIVHFSTPGDVIAAFIMTQQKPVYPVTAIAMGPSRFLKIPKENYTQLWIKQMNLIFRVQNLLSTRMHFLQEQKVLSKAPLSQKVAYLLMELVEKHPHDEGLILPLPLTRQEIADNLGASVESVIRIMSDWSKKGIIRTNEQQIQVLKPDVLLTGVREN